MPEGAKGTASDVYALDTGDSGAARLRLLDQVYGPFTRRMLLDAGLDEETRALDLACGIGSIACWMASWIGPAGAVVAGDVNPDQLVVAKSHCSKCEHLPTIDYIEANAYDTGLPAESFDLVHMRLLLCHLTEPAKALREVYRLLKAGWCLRLPGPENVQYLLLGGVFSLCPHDCACTGDGCGAGSGLRLRSAITGYGDGYRFPISRGSPGAARLSTGT
jgi:SAM-dependent methyltransferase